MKGITTTKRIEIKGEFFLDRWDKIKVKNGRGIYRLTNIALFVAIGLILHLLEALLPLLTPVPGAKMGLANIVTLMALVLYGAKGGGQVVMLRIFLGSFLTGTFLTVPFYLSLSGGILAFLTMAITISYGKDRFSMIGVSIIGAIFHNIGQIAAAALLVGNLGIFYYLPYLTLLALPTGFMVGIIAKYVLGVFGRVKPWGKS